MIRNFFLRTKIDRRKKINTTCKEANEEEEANVCVDKIDYSADRDSDSLIKKVEVKVKVV